MMGDRILNSDEKTTQRLEISQQVLQEDMLMVHNLIYQTIFNQDWRGVIRVYRS